MMRPETRTELVVDAANIESRWRLLRRRHIQLAGELSEVNNKMGDLQREYGAIGELLALEKVIIVNLEYLFRENQKGAPRSVTDELIEEPVGELGVPAEDALAEQPDFDQWRKKPHGRG